jgi:hypothetical protein
VFGEAGPEAIMPLTRGADGSLGVVLLGGNHRRYRTLQGRFRRSHESLSVVMPSTFTGKPDDITMQALIEGMTPGTADINT